ncbi:MAG TPA: tyrosine-type recombinase/integrase [Spirochaetota bacterium]|nr:tyrosine-type recombinase/integrase [Spirochaetota bacterium]
MKNPASKFPPYLTERELKRLIRGIHKGQHRIAVALMAYAGLRVSEVCSLRIGDLDLIRGSISVRGTGARERIVPMDLDLLKLIRPHLEKYAARIMPDSILIKEDSIALRHAVKRYCRQIIDRYDINCYNLRCIFASRLYGNGVSIGRISKLLGQPFSAMIKAGKGLVTAYRSDALFNLFGWLPHLKRSFRSTVENEIEITVKNNSILIGREKELRVLAEYLDQGISVMLYGSRGVGKTAILKSIPGTLYLDEFMRKQSLARILLDSSGLSGEEYEKVERKLKRLSVEELLRRIERIGRVVVIDDTTALSKPDLNTLTRLSQKTQVVAASSRPSDQRVLDTFIEIKPLEWRNYTQVISGMIEVSDEDRRYCVIDKIADSSGGNIKEAVYMLKQMQLGKNPEEIISEIREKEMVYIGPFLLLIVLFFIAWVYKSYNTVMIAKGYAFFFVFKIFFMRYIFVPWNRRKR